MLVENFHTLERQQKIVKVTVSNCLKAQLPGIYCFTNYYKFIIEKLLTTRFKHKVPAILFSVVLIGFSEDDYTADEGEPPDVSRPNTPCTVVVEVIERSLEIPLQIRLTPGEGNATSKKVEITYYYCKIGTLQTVHQCVNEQMDTC